MNILQKIQIFFLEMEVMTDNTTNSIRDYTYTSEEEDIYILCKKMLDDDSTRSLDPREFQEYVNKNYMEKIHFLLDSLINRKIRQTEEKYFTIISTLKRVEQHGNGLDQFQVEDLLASLDITNTEGSNDA
jgi:hypothetical protein